jgi:phage virion morphogenesis protein
MAEMQALETWAGELLQKLQPTQRRRLLTDIARRLRTANTQRIKAQTTPDGAAWQPRKKPGSTLRSRRAIIRQQAKQGRPMFQKIRQGKYLSAKAQGNSAAVVEFTSRAQRIAAVHHFGLTDKVQPGGPSYTYPARELLGITPADIETLRDALLDHLTA